MARLGNNPTEIFLGEMLSGNGLDIGIKSKTEDWGRINHKIVELGQWRFVSLITLLTVLMAVFIVYWMIYFFADEHFPLAFAVKVAAITPLIITPVVSWPLIRSHLKLAKIESSYYHYATYDMLTGALSRYAFFNSLRLINELAVRNKSTFVVAMVDIDDFKKINDSFGHAAGDALLKSLTNLINNSIRKSDVFGRLGGDEFMLVLPNTKLEDARMVLEKIRGLAERLIIDFYEQQFKFTLSIGLSEAEADKRVILSQLMESSDKALYLAKQNGKNCIMVNS